MKQHRYIRYSIALLSASLLFGSCQSDRLRQVEIPATEIGEKSDHNGANNLGPVSPYQTDAIVVKLKAEDMGLLRAVGHSGKTSLRSLSSEAQSSLRAIGAIEMTPYFADYDAYRERRQKAGLDRWMVVTFKGEYSPMQAQELLQQTENFEYVELQYLTAVPDDEVIIASQDMETSNRAAAEGDFNDPFLRYQWHYYNMALPSMPSSFAGSDINLPEAWQIETGKKEVVVCVVDAGVDYTHVDLAANFDLERSYSFIHDINGNEKGYKQIESQTSSHGTHVAGTIAAVNNNGIGVAGIAGGNGNPGTGVTIINAQILGSRYDRATPGTAGIVYGADHGAVISQNSWGYVFPGPKQLSQPDREAIDYFVKYAGCDEEGNQLPDAPMKGGVVIFAAGNDGMEYNCFPGAYENCISVASTGWNFKKASYSNWGDWVDITAPGGDQRYGENAGVLSTVPGNKYGFMQGTSMACPHVSGIAALVVSKFGGQGFTNEMLKERLLKAVRPYDLYDFNSPYLGKMGTGSIDAAVALVENKNIVPEDVKEVDVTPGYITADFTWAPAGDSDATAGEAYFYNLYLSEKEITAEAQDAKVYKVYPNYRNSSASIAYQLTGLQDGTTYHYAIEAVDFFGLKSANRATGSFQTQVNKAPEVTQGWSDEVIQLVNNQKTTLTFKVADPDGHRWNYTLEGNLYGITPQCDGETVTIEIVPIQEAGNHQLTLVLTDEYGKSNAYTITYQVSSYQPVTLGKNLTEQSITLDAKDEKIDLTTIFKSQPGAILSFTAKSESPETLDCTLDGGQLILTPKAKGRAVIAVTATDGITTATAHLQFLVK
ncbi:MAG: S8 family serine peptidase [Porphyromonas sp.]|nr:S8 family serine peptidase [Porphyromonas sp.]